MIIPCVLHGTEMRLLKVVEELGTSSVWVFSLSAGLPEAMPEEKRHVQ